MHAMHLRIAPITLCLSIGLCAIVASVSGEAVQDIPDVLKRSMALYPTLTSYADTGTVLVDSGGVKDRAKFKTYFRQPTDLFFEYYDHVSTSGTVPITMPTHLVVWMLNGEMEHWNGAAQSHEIISRASGRQVSALLGVSTASQGAAGLVPSLIFSTSRIVGPIQEVFQASLAGEEVLDGRKCHKVMGVARSVYPTGAVTNIRAVTVWVDAESLLIRKVFEDTPKGYPRGAQLHKTVVYQPQANVPLDAAKFQYKVPKP